MLSSRGHIIVASHPLEGCARKAAALHSCIYIYIYTARDIYRAASAAFYLGFVLMYIYTGVTRSTSRSIFAS